jgi:pyruvate/2-oxoglutarate/acetoin dehydrogenase E1 component
VTTVPTAAAAPEHAEGTRRRIMYRQALQEALAEELERDPRVFVLGEDILDPWGGSFKVTEGLSTRFGLERVRETPISEEAIVGCAVGAALAGMRPVAEIMFSDFAALAMDQIANQAAKARYMSGGQAEMSLVVRTAGGASRSAAAQHSQSLEAWFCHVPGLKVVMPSTPYDAKGLLKSAIRDPDPVIFIEHKMLYAHRAPVPEGEYLVPLGVADVKREGTDVSLIAMSRQVHNALEAAAVLQAEHGLSAEVVDVRTLYPLDRATLVASARKTGRVAIVSEAVTRGGYSAELASVIGEEAFGHLRAPVARVGALNTPLPFAPPLENHVLPSVARIVAAARSLAA